MGEDEEADNSAGTGTALADAPEQDVNPQQDTPSQDGGVDSAPSAWSSQLLPPELATKYPGTKTWGEFENRYSSSSGEARRFQSEAESQGRIASGYKALIAQMRAAPAQAPQIPGANGKGYFGYQSQDAYNAAYQADPQSAVNTMIRHAVLNDPELKKQLIDPVIQEQLQPVQQHMNEQRLSAQTQDFYSRFPDAKAGPLNAASVSYLNANPWVMGIQSLAPQANLPEVIYKLATYDILAQQVKAANGKVQQHAASAGTARPGSGGRAVPKDDSPRASVLAAAEEARAQGVEVPQHMIEAAVRSMERADWNRPKKNGR
jgi:hypothetical protein